VDEVLPASAQKVQDALAAAGVTAVLLQLPGSARTAAEAAQALGCEVGAIANSLIFIADGAPLLVMTSGAHRVAVDALARRLGKTQIRRATASEVRAATGQAIGGVAPIGHPVPVETVVDADLQRYERIWAAGGTPHTVFPTTFGGLLQLTGGASMPVVHAPVDLAERFSLFSERWSPKTVARLNDYEIKVVRLQGEFVWHTHHDTDELFLVIDGRLTIQMRGGDVELGPGQLFVVPRGVEHCPVTDGEVRALLIEPAGVVNTGDAGGPLTATPDDSLT
jgi:prolyl-tRNA editing enzyme YbaK/EbsC (Cys-tRNA(Pro) deacylase)/mannose-6-phosphate isomerase-like protein (cupin superfamily)